MLAVEPQVIETYVKPGKVKLVFRDVLNHGERSVRTSEAAACAGQQDRFWDMHTILFETQDTTWATSNDGLLALMRTHAKTLAGLDEGAFDRCMTERTTLKALQAADAEQRKRGINSQPIFEIAGQRLVGVQPFEVMAQRIEAALKR